MVNLNGEGGTLRIDIGENDWSRCELVTDEEEIYLGAETKEILVERLLNGLRIDATIDGEIEGRKVRWVLSLSEAHASLYASTDAADRTLFCQDKNGAVIGRISLSSGRSEEWRRQLEALRR